MRRSGTNCLGAMQIRGIRDICKSRQAREGAAQKSERLEEGGCFANGGRFVSRLLHPLKIQPGILLGTDLNNVVGERRNGRREGRPGRRRVLLRTTLLSSLVTLRPRNSKLESCATRCEQRHRGKEAKKFLVVARAFSRFPDIRRARGDRLPVIRLDGGSEIRARIHGRAFASGTASGIPTARRPHSPSSPVAAQASRHPGKRSLSFAFARRRDESRESAKLTHFLSTDRLISCESKFSD